MPDPGSEFFQSRIRIFSIPDPNFFHPGSRIQIKEFKYFYPKKWFLCSWKYDPGCSFRIRILTFYPSWIQGSKKAPDPGSGSATLARVCWSLLCLCRSFLMFRSYLWCQLERYYALFVFRLTIYSAEGISSPAGFKVLPVLVY